MLLVLQFISSTQIAITRPFSHGRPPIPWRDQTGPLKLVAIDTGTGVVQLNPEDGGVVVATVRSNLRVKDNAGLHIYHSTKEVQVARDGFDDGMSVSLGFLCFWFVVTLLCIFVQVHRTCWETSLYSFSYFGEVQGVLVSKHVSWHCRRLRWFAFLHFVRGLVQAHTCEPACEVVGEVELVVQKRTLFGIQYRTGLIARVALAAGNRIPRVPSPSSPKGGVSRSEVWGRRTNWRGQHHSRVPQSARAQFTRRRQRLDGRAASRVCCGRRTIRCPRRMNGVHSPQQPRENDEKQCTSDLELSFYSCTGYEHAPALIARRLPVGIAVGAVELSFLHLHFSLSVVAVLPPTPGC